MSRHTTNTAIAALWGLGLLLCGCPLLAQGAATETNVVYGTADGENLVLDAYRCGTPGPHPALVFIHGGGWAGGDKDAYRDQCAQWAQAEGVVCFSINYRLAPKFLYPSQVLDCARAVRWIRAHAQEYDVDPTRIGALGHSAGGHLSLMLGAMGPEDFQTPDDPNRALSAKVQCVADLAGPADFTAGTEWPEVTVGIVAAWIGAPRAEAPDKYREASPITYVTPDDAAVLFLYGDRDPLVPLQQAERMKAALDGVHVETELLVIRDGDHGFQGGDPAALGQAFARIAEWLRAHLGVQPPKP